MKVKSKKELLEEIEELKEIAEIQRRAIKEWSENCRNRDDKIEKMVDEKAKTIVFAGMLIVCSFLLCLTYWR